MHNWLSYDSPFITKLNVAADFLIINILYVICCIPIITIGAATSALYSIGFRFWGKKDYGAKVYLREFLHNFKSITLPWLAFLLVGLFFLFDISLLVANQLPSFKIITALLAILLLGWSMFCCQLFLINARFTCTHKQLFQNAVLITLAHPVRSLFTAILFIAIPFIILIFDPYTFFSLFPLWLLIYFSLSALLITKVMKSPYDKYTETN